MLGNAYVKDLLRIDRIPKFSPPCFGFPDRLLTKLRYHDGVDLTSTAGSQALYQLRWNSTFDPDFTSTGHQPLYRDTFASLYDQYVVCSAVCTVVFTNKVSGNTFIVGVVTDDDTSAATSVTTICEQNHAQWAILAMNVGGANQKKFRITWDYARYLGVDPFTSQTAKTAIGANPSEVSFLNIFGYEHVGGTGDFVVDFTLEQEVLWSELQTPTGS